MSHQSHPEPSSNLRSNQRNIRSLLLGKSPSKAQSTTITSTTTTATTLRSTTGSLPGQIDQESQENRPEESSPTRPRKYHILTNAGKPVWSTEHEDENRPDGDITSQMGLIQAVISIFEVDNDDQLRYIDAGQTKIAVMSRPPLYFLAVSNWGEPESTLRMHLEYLNLLIQSILSTTQLKKIFDYRPNYDLKGGLTGTESIFNGLVDRLQWDLSIMMSSLSVYRCPAEIRGRISKLITPVTNPHPNNPDGQLHSLAGKLLYSIVITHAKVLSVVRPKNHSVHPSDLQIIMTTVLSSNSIKSSESWIPICLPGYNATGFLHAYVKFEPRLDVGLVLISKDRTGFYEAQRWSETIFEDPVWDELCRLRNPAHPDLPSLPPSSSTSSSSSLKADTQGKRSEYQGRGREKHSLENPLNDRSWGEYSLENLGIPGLRHFIYKDKKYVQASYPSWEDDYLIELNRQRLIVNYQRAFDIIHPKKPKLIKKIDAGPKNVNNHSSTDQEHDSASSCCLPPPVKFTLFKTQYESVIGWITDSYEVFVTVSPLISKSAAILIVHSIVNWVKTHYQSLFLTSSNQF